ncbi:hypothetical protein B9Q02_08385 [Candidatus Marsarchaeota G1 archaeon BE_D]|uniref:Cas12f1-like TNB domain-containing protein n=1 Tax=Candidatus Marsarchaeota G1 archaeon BE_D TaxID=1978156 RepID=A0A2R6AF02_9ARCH|nr:MAG: hypothetical protein B9Q02_08385 [Candidatus Marsarchaeota G1 archaeon BE_D]
MPGVFLNEEKPCSLYPLTTACVNLCGRINQNLLENRVFHCPHCGFTLDRDLNASLLKKGGCHPGSLKSFAQCPPWGWQGDARRSNDSGSFRLQAGVAHLLFYNFGF